MERFRDILVIPATLTAGDPALGRALALAEAGPVKITVGWPVEEPEAGASDTLRQAALDAERAALEELLERVAHPGAELASGLVIGRPYTAIIHRVLTRGHDLVIKTARGRRLRQNLIFGSTALHLLRNCPCPVWVVDDQGPGRPGPVLAAVDPATMEPGAAELAAAIVDHAVFLAERDRVPLHVAHAWSAPYEQTLRHSGFIRMPEDQVRVYVEDAEKRHARAFDALMAPLAGRAEPHFVKGEPAEVVSRLVEELGISTLVIGTVARTGVPGLLIGNTAESLVSQVRCSVLAIKPPGFVSPMARAR